MIITRPTRTRAPEPPPAAPAEPMPVRVLVEEVPAPGHPRQLPVTETALQDSRSLATARRSRRGGYLRMPLEALKALGKKAVLLDKFVRGSDLVLRIRVLPA